jgi:uncharacterized protein (TIGR02246 family)
MTTTTAITDSDAVKNLIGRFAQLTDDGDFESRAQLYADDGVFVGFDGSEHRGRAAIRELFEKLTPPTRTGKHITGNASVTVDGDRASASTDYVFFRLAEDGIAVLSTGRYQDEFVRGPDGWLFSSRRIVPQTLPG